MLKRFAKDMNFDDFKDALTSEMVNDLAKMNISYQKAYCLFQSMFAESRHEDDDDIGTMDSIVKNIILDFKEEFI